MTAGLLPPRTGGAGRDPGPVDAYVRDLAGRLRGPRRLRQDLLDEARSGLLDAADELATSGLDAPAAERAAVADFGPARQLAAEYQEQLSLAQGRRTAVFAALVFPALTLAWQLVWVVPRGQTYPPAPGYFQVLATLIDHFAVAGTVIALVGLVALRLRGVRRFAHAATTILGVLVLAAMLATLALSLVMNLAHVRGYEPTTFGPFGLWVTAVTVVAVGMFLRTTYRSIRAGHAGFHLSPARRTA